MENNALEMYNKMYENLEEALSSYCLMDMKQLKLNICDKIVEDMGDMDKFKVAHMIVEKDFKEYVESKFNTAVDELLSRIEYKITNKFNLHSDGYKTEDGKTYIELENTKINLSDKTYEIVTNRMIDSEDARVALNAKNEIEKIAEYVSKEISKCKNISKNYHILESARYRTMSMSNEGFGIERIVMFNEMCAESGGAVRDVRKVRGLVDVSKYRSYCRTLSSVIEMALYNIEECIQGIKQYELIIKNKEGLKLFTTVNAQKEIEIINDLKPKLTERKYYARKLLSELELNMCKNNRNLRNFASAKSIESTIELCKVLDKCGYECEDRYEISKAERLLERNVI